MMRKKIILTLMCLLIAVVNTQANKGYDWSRVINAIIQVESKGDPKAHNKVGDCVGILQIRKVLVKECNQILKKKNLKKRYTIQDRWDAKKSKEMFVLLQEHFNKEHNIEKAIKCWNCGFYAKDWKQRSITYHKNVMKNYYNKRGK